MQMTHRLLAVFLWPVLLLFLALLTVAFLETTLPLYKEPVLPSFQTHWYSAAAIALALFALLKMYDLSVETEARLAELKTVTDQLGENIGRLQRMMDHIGGMPEYLIRAADMYRDAEGETVTVLGSWHWTDLLRDALTDSRAKRQTFIGPICLDHNFGGLICRFGLGVTKQKRFVLYHADRVPGRFIVTDKALLTTGSTEIGDRVMGFIPSRDEKIREFFVEFHKIMLQMPARYGIRSFRERITDVLAKDIWPQVGGGLEWKTVAKLLERVWELYSGRCDAKTKTGRSDDLPVDRREFDGGMVELLKYLESGGAIDVSGNLEQPGECSIRLANTRVGRVVAVD